MAKRKPAESDMSEKDKAVNRMFSVADNRFRQLGSAIDSDIKRMDAKIKQSEPNRKHLDKRLEKLKQKEQLPSASDFRSAGRRVRSLGNSEKREMGSDLPRLLRNLVNVGKGPLKARQAELDAHTQHKALSTMALFHNVGSPDHDPVRLTADSRSHIDLLSKSVDAIQRCAQILGRFKEEDEDEDEDT